MSGFQQTIYRVLYVSILVEGVDKKFTARSGVVEALQNVSAEIMMGQFTVLLGPSGCGKTTLLRIIAGLDDPSSGAVDVDGKTPEYARHSKQLGVVFQRPALLSWRTVRQNVALPQELSQAGDSVRADDLINLVGLNGFENSLPNQLSGGMQSRVAIARALMLEPSILLMDEPLGALDQITRERMQIELARIVENQAMTVVMVTHSIPEALFLADRIFVMSARPGRIIEDIAVPFERPRSLIVEDDSRFFKHAKKLRQLLIFDSGHRAVEPPPDTT